VDINKPYDAIKSLIVFFLVNMSTIISNRLLIISLLIFVVQSSLRITRTIQNPLISLPPIDQSVSDYVSQMGYELEEHKVHTIDGYILTIWRLPSKAGISGNRKSVLLQHGIFDTGFSWLFQETKKNLAIMLVDQGYDVWIGNVRGNMYSMEHENMKIFNPYNYSSPFWDFSWDEMGKYDLPAMVTYIKGKTQTEKINYVCHSQGCTMILVLGCLDPNFITTNIEKATLFAPAMYAFDQESIPVDLLRIISFSQHFLETGLKLLFGEGIYRQLSAFIAENAPYLWLNGIHFAAGWTKRIHFDVKRLPILAGRVPGGASLNSFNHYVQGVYYDDFRMYDFGKYENLRRYNQETPPIYEVTNLSKIDIKWYVVYGEKDCLITPRGVKKMLKLFKPNSYISEMPFDMNHMDVVWGDEAHKTTFVRILNFFNNEVYSVTVSE